jgi:hypothetical protein
MNKMIIVSLLIAALPAIANAEMKMKNTNPSPKTTEEPILEHHMQNRDPNPAAATEQTQKPEHVMQNSNPSSDKVPEHTMKNSNPNK